jgi:glycosyltransferase involved in cell wall biosynthesis
MKQVLLTVSGVVDPTVEAQVAAGTRPLPDYIAMARAFDADLLDYREARESTGAFGRLLEKIGGPNLTLAWACFKRRKHYRVIFTDGEQIGIPLATLCKAVGWTRTAHLMIVHNLAVPKKMIFFDWLGIHSHVNTFFVYSTWQKRFIEQRWKISSDRVIRTPFMVDSAFFSLDRIHVRRKRMICSAGLEFRDYPTLMKAVQGLDIDVVIAAASPWSKRQDTTTAQSIPANVTVQRLSQFELRQIYGDSLFVVMPLYNVNFQAGVTAILEAMAMERAVVCSLTPGQTDVIVDGETGVYVPPEDPEALRAAIERLIDHSEEAERMGKAGRAKVEREMKLERYVAGLHTHVQNALAASDGAITAGGD